MLVSRKFLNDFIDLNKISTEEIASKLLDLGNEFEAIKPLAQGTNLVIGKVIECEKIVKSDHLHKTKVDIGTEVLDIVCGAPNVRSGIKVIVAQNGSKLPGGVIKKTILAGEVSNGMICSLEELGISSKYLSEEDKDGIHILEDEAPLGEEVLNYLELDDEIIDFDLTADRADLHSIIGFAREANVFLGKDINIPETKYEENIKFNDYLKVKVNTDKVPVYLGAIVKDIKIGESPRFIKNRLIASGIRPINNVVDISNYVMLEFGNPLHFFDLDKLDKSIEVELGGSKTITTLDSKNRELIDSDILIKSAGKPVAIAGIMGSLDSEVTAKTKNIFIEAAIFDKYHIRQTSKRLNLPSEAASRFIKGLNNEDVYTALKRAIYLLKKYAGASFYSDIFVHDKTSHKDNIVEINKDNINGLLSINLSTSEIIDIFERLSFKAVEKEGIIKVTVPAFRQDIAITEDLIEEIARVHGINNIESTLVNFSGENFGLSKEMRHMRNIRDRFIHLGFQEVITYNLVSAKDLEIFYTNNSYKMLQPMSDDHSYTRNSLLPSLYKTAVYNINRGNKDFKILEMSKIYEKDLTSTYLSGLIMGDNNIYPSESLLMKYNYKYLKGLMTNVLNYAGFTGRFTFEEDTVKGMHKYQALRIKVGKEDIGFMGMLDPELFNYTPYVFELNLDKILSIKIGNIKDKGAKLYPVVVKDIAFKVKTDTKYEDLYKLIKSTCGDMFDSAYLFDEYTGENLEEGYKSMAFKINFYNKDKTLSADEVMDVIEKLKDKAFKRGYEIRDN